ncbi:ATP synthase E chain domain containing protein [Elaphomyces granulatus]|jgi:F-type H+-transporting ATP synthase subunit e
MASSQGVNVLRYSALVAGLIYGLYHQSSLNTQAKYAEIDREYKRKESLIEQAKTEWKKKTMPPETKSGSTGIITDPEDSRFDLEAYLKLKAGDTAK